MRRTLRMLWNVLLAVVVWLVFTVGIAVVISAAL